MAEPDRLITESVRKRLELINGEIAEVLAQRDTIRDPEVYLRRLIDAHTQAIQGLGTITALLATEIDFLRHQPRPPR